MKNLTLALCFNDLFTTFGAATPIGLAANLALENRILY